MATITLAVLQTFENCRWSRLGYRLSGVAEKDQPEGRWMCGGPTPAGNRRANADNGCAMCSDWEPMPPAVVDAGGGRGSIARGPMPSVGHHWLASAEHALLRALVITAGIVLAAVGVGMSLSVVLLPLGLVLGLFAVGIVVWGAIGDVFGVESTTPLQGPRP